MFHIKKIGHGRAIVGALRCTLTTPSAAMTDGDAVRQPVAGQPAAAGRGLHGPLRLRLILLSRPVSDAVRVRHHRHRAGAGRRRRPSLQQARSHVARGARIYLLGHDDSGQEHALSAPPQRHTNAAASASRLSGNFHTFLVRFPFLVIVTSYYYYIIDIRVCIDRSN